MSAPSPPSPRETPMRSVPIRPGAELAPFGRTVLVMTLAALLVPGQMYVVLPLLTGMSGDWGGNPQRMVWTLTAFGLAFVMGAVVAGPLADRFGRRPVVIAGLAVVAFASAVLAAAPSLEVGVWSRVAQGIGAAAFSRVALTYLGERVVPGRRWAAWSAITTAAFASLPAGQAAAEFLAAIVGWRGVFGASAVASVLLAMLVRLVMLPDVPAGEEPTTSVRVLGHFVARGRVLLLSLVMLATLASLGSVFTVAQLAAPTDWNTDTTYTLSACSAAVIVVVAAATVWLRRWPPTRLAVVALLVAALATVVLALGGRSVPVAVLAVLTLVAATAVVPSALVSAALSMVGQATGPLTSLLVLVALLGATLGPQLVAWGSGTGFAAVLLMVGLVQLVSAGLVFLAERQASAASGRASR
ncbi:major facilitator superfamily protein [Longimycelium tulufanense]|uniref:Major facilitator superfamily protein n=1 Tax=Longimycelium tulufanense TaxID=907463 RepID=A0A8J3FVP8_9PSEU|nr:MFS transporter [Longimycelium tulufanense]GGM59833.1 major facilitator superfamily protein [Longimycelium tulufanense]